MTQKVLTTVDTALLGRVSTSALASVGLAAPVYIVATMVAVGWATATDVFVAQRYGAGEHAEVGRVTDAGLVLSVVTGAAVTYLRILAFAVPVTAAIFALQSAFSGVGATRVAMHTAFVVNAVDIPLSVIMIFGLGWGVDCRGHDRWARVPTT